MPKHSVTLKIQINYQCPEEIEWKDIVARYLDEIAMDSLMTESPIELQDGCKVETLA